MGTRYFLGFFFLSFFRSLFLIGAAGDEAIYPWWPPSILLYAMYFIGKKWNGNKTQKYCEAQMKRGALSRRIRKNKGNVEGKGNALLEEVPSNWERQRKDCRWDLVVLRALRDGAAAPVWSFHFFCYFGCAAFPAASN